MAELPTYNPSEIESKWQARWEAGGLYVSDIDLNRPKHYALTMLPYPSGDLHIGHWYAMTPSDARARYMRMRGYNVLFPMGFDSFGLPAENAAIKRGIHPRQWTYANIERMRTQLRSMGAMFDWRREAVSSDPEYYRWSEWFFTQLRKHDLAYRKLSPVDWCPNCNTTLAREQVWGDDRHCERCGTPVIKKDLPERWPYAFGKHASELEVRRAVDARLETVIVNPSAVFGAGDWYRRQRSLVAHAARGAPIPILPGGVNAVHIDDVIDGHLAALERGRPGERYILGGENLTLETMLRTTAEVVGRRPPALRLPLWAVPLIRALLEPLRTQLRLPIEPSLLWLAGYYFFYDTHKAQAELGLPSPRPYRIAAAQTFAWLRTADSFSQRVPGPGSQ